MGHPAEGATLCQTWLDRMKNNRGKLPLEALPLLKSRATCLLATGDKARAATNLKQRLALMEAAEKGTFDESEIAEAKEELAEAMR